MPDFHKLTLGLILSALGGFFAFTGYSVESVICIVGSFILFGLME